MDYYSVLGISKKATDKEIKNAYRKLAKKYHPDTYKGDKTFAENKMKELNEAYDVLSNEDRRNSVLEQDEENVYEEVNRSRGYTSNYEEGTVYDFDKHYRQASKTQNNYSYYNYTPYEDKNDYTNYYYIDFNQLKDKLFKHFKRITIVFILVILIVIATLITLFNMLFSGIDNLVKSFTSEPVKVSEPKESDIQPKDDTTKKIKEETNLKWEDVNEAYNKYLEENKEKIDNMNTAYEEWYNTEGKKYEAELNEFLKNLQ